VWQAGETHSGQEVQTLEWLITIASMEGLNSAFNAIN
jgi:hypothetical protein